MDFILEYYFDFGRMIDELGPVLEGFWYTLKPRSSPGSCRWSGGRPRGSPPIAPAGRWRRSAGWRLGISTSFEWIPLLLVLLLVSGFLSSAASPVGGELIPRSIGLPEWLGQPSPFWYGIIALTITYGAYMAEVYRAGIEAVPAGRWRRRARSA